MLSKPEPQAGSGFALIFAKTDVAMSQLYCGEFVVDKRPFCVWEWDLPERNRSFLESIDPDYFLYLTETHAANLDGEHRNHAALALRMAYSHALETFFALVGTLVQAHECPVGWMAKYRDGDLKSLVKKIQTEQPVYTKLKLSPITWSNLSRVVNQFPDDPPDADDSWKTLFAQFWQLCAREFLSDRLYQEYNAAKHGLRLRSRGFRLAARPADAPEEQSESLGGSDFGAGFYQPETITDDRNLRMRQVHRNWHPKCLVARLQLLAVSMWNCLAHLKAANGEPDVKLRRLEDKSLFRDAHDVPAGAIEFDLERGIRPEHITPRSAEDILASYRTD